MRMSILWTVWMIVLSRFFPYKSNIHEQQYSFSYFFISLVVESFWQLRFVEDLTKTHYWFSRLTILKGRDVFFLRTLACKPYWTLGLLLGLWLNSNF